MKVAVYDPYLDTAGGGEKYMMAIAEALSSDNRVDVLLDSHLSAMDMEAVKKKLEDRHALDLSKTSFKKAPIGKGSSFLSRSLFLKQYDWFFYMTDGSIFFATAKNNVIHFQMPFDNTDARDLWGRIKMSPWKTAIYNSEFTKDYVEVRWPVKGQVIYPPVDVQRFKVLAKKKQIVSVGRFSEFTKMKKHELLIDIFKELMEEERMKGWSLHLAGGLEEGNGGYLEELEKKAGSSDVIFYPNVGLEELAKLYGESSIYWHAAGFDEEDPKKSEHFGITTVEAMASGCVPVVINLGGQREIVENDSSGFLWDSLEEFKSYSMKVAEDEKLRKRLSEGAVERSMVFSKAAFVRKVKELVSEN